MRFKPIRAAEELGEAKSTLARLLAKNNAGIHDDDIEVLSLLIHQYEQAQIRIEAPPPIAAIQFRMKEMGLSPRHLEPFIGSRARVSEILTGKRSLSIDMIRSLHEGLGIPYASLISERTRATKADIEVSTPTIARLNALGFDVDQRDVSAFVRSSLPQGVSPALHRKTRTQRAAVKTDQAALAVWQAAVLKKADADNLKTIFDRKSLSAEAIRRLALLSSAQCGPLKAIDALRAKGVSTIIMPPLPGTFLDGATMLNVSGRPIIGLTLRHDRTDGFWFTLLHEVAHIHLHYEKLRSEQSSFVDDIDIQSDDIEEREADTLAKTSLIPDSFFSQVRWDKHSTSADITAVASRARVHVSIVAGRWQRDHQNYRKFSRLIERNVLTSMLSK